MKHLCIFPLLLLTSFVPKEKASYDKAKEVTVTQVTVYKHTWLQEDGRFFYPDSSIQLVSTVAYANQPSPGTETKRSVYSKAVEPVVLPMIQPAHFQLSDSSCELALLSIVPQEQNPGIKAAVVMTKFSFKFSDDQFRSRPASVTFQNEHTTVEMALKWE